MTLTYPSGKGDFDLDFRIKEGTVTGYLGPNGAGKTTTIRALMGFMAPDSGFCKIDGLDAVSQAPAIQRILGYVPGEITFLEGMKGQEFLKFMGQMRGVHNKKYVDELFERFDVDPTGKIKKLSKGNKQKLAIIAAFMHDPKVLVLDEPTSGLDPLMQKRFVELIKDEKKKSKTILMSSHIFEEVEKTCDDVIIIRDGRIVHASDVEGLIQAMGFSDMLTDLNSYLASWLYGMLMLAFPMVYSILLGHKLLCKMVDNSSFAYLLSTPHSRVKIVLTQGIYALSTMVVLFFLVFLVGVGTSEMFFPGQLDVMTYFKLNVTTMLVNMLVLMIVFLFSAVSNDAKYSVAFGSGVPIMFLLFNMLANASDKAEILGKLTPYGYYDPVELVKGADTLGINLVFLFGAFVLLGVSVWIFNRKRLPL